MKVKRLPSAYVIPGYTFFYWGFSLPNDLWPAFQKHFRFTDGGLTKPIELVIGSKTYPAKVRLARQTSKKFAQREVVQITYVSEVDTLKVLRKELIYSYATTIDKSKPELKELIEVAHLGGNRFKIHFIARQKTDFNLLLRQLEDRNLLEYWAKGKDKKDQFVLSYARKWHSVKEWLKYRDRINCIYALYNTKRKQLYVGKANNLALRVRPGIGRTALDDEWDKFMFFEINPLYAHLIEKIESFVIRVLATQMQNGVGIDPLPTRNIELVNRHLRQKST